MLLAGLRFTNGKGTSSEIYGHRDSNAHKERRRKLPLFDRVRSAFIQYSVNLRGVLETEPTLPSELNENVLTETVPVCFAFFSSTGYSGAGAKNWSGN